MRFCWLLVVAVLRADCIAESDFDLEEDSRLPRWFVLPEGVQRSDVTVNLAFYVTSIPRDVSLTFRIWGGKKLGSIYGDILNDSSGPREGALSAYIAIRANEIIDIVQRRGGYPTFRMNDDPNVWRALGVER